MDQLAAHLKIDPIALRRCIQFEILHQRPVFESYKNVCKIFGDDFMDYREFKVWYTICYNGEYDVDHDQNQDPEPMTFSGLPVEMVSKIVKELDPLSRIATRHVSESLQFIVDRMHTDVKCLAITLYETHAVLDIDGRCIRYYGSPNRCQIEYNSKPLNIKRGSFSRLVISDVASLLNNHRLNLDTIIFTIRNFPWTELMDQISTCRISAKCLKTRLFEGAFPTFILPIFNPGKLEKIDFRNPYNDVLDIEELAKMEQWRQAKEIHCSPWVNMERVRLDHFYHLEKFTVNVGKMSVEELIRVRDNLLQSGVFQDCRIRHQFGLNALAELKNNGIPGSQNIDGRLRIPINGSMECLEFRNSFGHAFKVERRMM